MKLKEQDSELAPAAHRGDKMIDCTAEQQQSSGVFFFSFFTLGFRSRRHIDNLSVWTMFQALSIFSGSRHHRFISPRDPLEINSLGDRGK